jgi:GDP-4-dehydro-6-deoxy-D-mannose reductase
MTKQTAPILITGVNGFVGKHLVREIARNNISVIGVGREPTADPEISKLLQEYVNIDLTKEWPKTDEVSAVIHLAGLAAVGPSFKNPQDYLNLNSAMVTNMCEYYLTKTNKPRIVVVSSGAIYDPSQNMPLTEDSEIGYYSPYAVSKVLVEKQCAYYRNRGLDCVVVRPFNHIGPGQSEGFLVPDVVSQLRVGETVTVGNISTKRDYTDVRDIVRAYRLLATTPKLSHGVYNACSGTSTSGEEIVDLLKEVLKKLSAEVIVDQSRVRPTDPAEIYGDASRLSGDTGWVPEIKLEQTLLDVVGS